MMIDLMMVCRYPLLVAFGLLSVLLKAESTDPAEDTLYSPYRDERRYNCDIYLAPSPPRGWGVYAARDFEKNDVIEVSPRFIPQKQEILGQSVLDDYHYAWRWESNPEDITTYGVIVFGMTMFYNHGEGDLHNVRFTNFGREPDYNHPMSAMAIGFSAKRKILRGEELLSYYGGVQWFRDRGLSMEVPKTAPKLPSIEIMRDMEQRYCSKAVAGLGHSTWNRVIATQQIFGEYLPQLNPDEFLPLQDHPTAVAKEAIRAGQIIEISPALVMPVDQVRNSPLEPLSFFWDDWDKEQENAIYKLREQGAFRMKGRNNETGAFEIDILDFYNDAAVLAVAGNIGMVRKVGRDNNQSNCRLEVAASVNNTESDDIGSAGLVLKLIATHDIPAGEELRLNMPESSSWESKMSLLQHLAMTGQPIPKFIADPYNRNVGVIHDDDAQTGDSKWDEL